MAVEDGAAQWAYDKSQPAGAGTDTLAGNHEFTPQLSADGRGGDQEPKQPPRVAAAGAHDARRLGAVQIKHGAALWLT